MNVIHWCPSLLQLISSVSRPCWGEDIGGVRTLVRMRTLVRLRTLVWWGHWWGWWSCPVRKYICDDRPSFCCGYIPIFRTSLAQLSCSYRLVTFPSLETHPLLVPFNFPLRCLSCHPSCHVSLDRVLHIVTCPYVRCPSQLTLKQSTSSTKLLVRLSTND